MAVAASSRSALAGEIAAIARLTGSFVLRSGATTNEYFDKYQFESDPRLLRAIADEMVALIPDGTEVLAGLELGGVPIATALSLATGLPTSFVRKAAKKYGTCRIVEGADVRGRRVTIIEDVVTSGGAVVDSIGALRAEGAVIENALCVIDREAGGAAALEALGVRLRPLFRMSEVPATPGR